MKWNLFKRAKKASPAVILSNARTNARFMRLVYYFPVYDAPDTYRRVISEYYPS